MECDSPEPSLRAADSITDVVRAQRFELVDPQGRLRAVLANGDPVFEGSLTGLTLFGPDGSQRAVFGIHDCGVLLSLSLAGNVALEPGVYDHHLQAAIPGPYLILCGRDGDPVFAERPMRR